MLIGFVGQIPGYVGTNLFFFGWYSKAVRAVLHLAGSHTPLMSAVVYILVLESAVSSAQLVWQMRHCPWRVHAKV